MSVLIERLLNEAMERMGEPSWLAGNFMQGVYAAAVVLMWLGAIGICLALMLR